MNILVIGGSGHIGGFLSPQLAQQRAEVVIDIPGADVPATYQAAKKPKN